MDRVGTGFPGRADVLGRVEVAPDLKGLVGRPGVKRAEVVGRDDRHGRDLQLAAGAEDAERDLAPVRHENLPHRREDSG